MPKVFVFAALKPTGGAYMAYHVGRLLHMHFGYELIDVKVDQSDKTIFHYDIPVTSVSVADMEKTITAQDILLLNPYYSHLLFGLRLPGRKIMYVQGFPTFHLLDCHFDLYVSVSTPVQNFLSSVYGMTTPLVPAFVDHKNLPEVLPWHQRPVASAIVYMKHRGTEHERLLAYLKAGLKDKAPHLDLSRVVHGNELPQQEFLRALGSVRYLINLSTLEGFGLVALEAMALGTMVTGVDSLGSVEYMQDGHNCLVVSVKNMRPLPKVVYRAVSDEKLAAQCSEQGRKTALRYDYAAFKSGWLDVLSAFLKTPPSNLS